MTDANIKSFTEFQPLALRTESQIDSVNANVDLLRLFLQTHIAITEVLDGVKKQVFYSNPKKLFSELPGKVTDILEAARDMDDMILSNDQTQKSEIEIHPRLFHGLLGAITESGELSQHLLNIINGGPVDVAGIGEEFSDHDWYKAVTFDHLNIDYYTALTNVINKLRVRFPDKYSDEAAANRNLDAERAELERNLSLKADQEEKERVQ